MVMAEVLKKHQKLTEQVVTEMLGDFPIKKYKRKGICLLAGNFFRGHFATK